MNNDFCDISIVLDRSGSMELIRSDTIGGFNAFITAQRALPGKCTVSLVQFDNQYEPVYTARPVAEAPLLTTETFVPRGGTALLDAIGRTIVETGARLSKMPEAERPAKVLFVIQTDGLENASREWTRDKVSTLIAQQTDVYKWNFVYLGANQDAIAVGASMNIPASSSMKFAATADGTQSASASVARYATNYRTTGVASFTDEDRQKQEKAGAVK